MIKHLTTRVVLAITLVAIALALAGAVFVATAPPAGAIDDDNPLDPSTFYDVPPMTVPQCAVPDEEREFAPCDELLRETRQSCEAWFRALCPTILPAEGLITPIALYRVQPGDTLWSIAEEHFGDPTRWRELGTPYVAAPRELPPGHPVSLPLEEVPTADELDQPTALSTHFYEP